MTEHAHWVYVAGVVLLLVLMAARRSVVVPAVLATALTAWAFTGSPFAAVAAPFNALTVATTELLNIFLVLAVVGAMTGALRGMHVDTLMLEPLTRVMRNGHLAFAVLFVASYVMSLVLWPTPTLAILAAVLVPAAIAAGLTRLGAAIAVALSGQGMALASDYVMGVAPDITASGADLDAGVIADRALLLSWVVGAVAVALAYLVTERGRLVAPATTRRLSEPAEIAGAVSAGLTRRETHPETALPQLGGSAEDAPEVRETTPRRRRAVAVLVPLAFAAMVLVLVLSRFTDLFPTVPDLSGAALVAGVGLGVLVLVCAVSARSPLEAVSEHLVGGLVFAFRAMGAILPVAGFVLMGVGDFSGRVMSLPDGVETPAFLFDVIRSMQGHVPSVGVATCLALMVAGMLIGLDGSGWAGLPLIGSLSAALGPESGMDPETLAAIGQNAASWTGGGTLVVWSSLVAVAGVTGVPVAELVRRLFVPVVSGLVCATLLASVVL